VEKLIPEQVRHVGIPEAEVVKNVMLTKTIDRKLTTAQDVSETAAFW
jgi:3-hydroxybutyrate dehydrogenase